MRRTTTATHKLTFPISLQLATDLQITYAQGGSIILVKDMDDVTVDDKTCTIELSEQETKRFEAEKPVELQAKIALTDGQVIASQIKRIPATRILNEELFTAEEEPEEPEEPQTEEQTEAE